MSHCTTSESVYSTVLQTHSTVETSHSTDPSDDFIWQERPS